jgi:excinuclease ABC subunit A
MQSQIVVRNARLHNLKNITLSIPKNQFVVFTGLSGSGKSSLAFDTLHQESQRQFMESLGMVTDGLSKPPLDSIEGLAPSISVDQHLTNHSPRSTVGTVTEVYTYLRVLFARLGHRPCPQCGGDVPPSADAPGETWDDGDGNDESTYLCPHCGHPIPELGMAHFSFNKPAGACPTCTGLGQVLTARVETLVDLERSILDGAVYGWDAFFVARYKEALVAAGKHYGFEFDPALPVKEYTSIQRDLLFYGVNGAAFTRHFPGVKPPDTVARGSFEGLVTNLLRRYANLEGETSYREKMEQQLISQTCSACGGTRLKAESRAVTILGQDIITISQLPLSALLEWVTALTDNIAGELAAIAAPIIADLRGRIGRLVDVGVGYLTLERSSPTLSMGEAQRLRLASLLGSGLTGVLYILDEPTIGLHPRDNQRLITVLKQLRDLGNTVLVIEHDLDFLHAADYVVDFGPGAGKDGGRVVAAGTPAEIAAEPGSLTGQYLSGTLTLPQPPRRPPNGKAIVIRGARQHNLKNITARIPLGMLVAITGASGSGKSSLLFDIFDAAARQRLHGASSPSTGSGRALADYDSIEGWHYLDRVITIDQSAIGRSPRSNAATYTDAFTAMREAFAATAEAKRRGLTARHFSFNTPGGRCERCEGAGILNISMHFLPDVPVRCPACHGRRFKKDVLAVKYNGVDVAEALELTIAEALPHFADVPGVVSRLQVMADVGLGYLQLGQPATTLSGGEAQRVKLAKELGRKSGADSRRPGHTLYLLDEPTTGLHVADIARLLILLQRLVEAANSVIVIEHNLELIRSADWVIDLGPEGGAAGGEIVAEGTPEQVAQVAASHTGRFLAGQ